MEKSTLNSFAEVMPEGMSPQLIKKVDKYIQTHMADSDNLARTVNHMIASGKITEEESATIHFALIKTLAFEVGANVRVHIDASTADPREVVASLLVGTGLISMDDDRELQDIIEDAMDTLRHLQQPEGRNQ